MFQSVFCLWLFLGGAEAAGDPPCGGAWIENADVSWLTRDRAGVTEAAIEVLEAARAREPGCFDLRWRLARFYYWHASSVGVSSVRIAESGWQEAQEAIRLAPDRVEGHYWAAANAGTWAERLSVPAAFAMGMPDRFETPAKRAVALDPHHDGGGPARTLGIYYARLPWPFRDLDQAEVLLRQALAAHPNGAANLYYLAELEDRKGNRTARDQRLFRLERSSGDDGPRTARYRRMGRALSRAGS